MKARGLGLTDAARGASSVVTMGSDMMEHGNHRRHISRRTALTGSVRALGAYVQGEISPKGWCQLFSAKSFVIRIVGLKADDVRNVFATRGAIVHLTRSRIGLGVKFLWPSLT